MRNELVTWFFSISTLTFFYCITTPVHSQCLEDQQSWLLQLKHNLQFNPSSSLASWNQSNNCCVWSGVTCDNSGHVLGLNLAEEIISGSLPSSFANLSYLVDLDLSHNNLTGLIPSFQGSENLRSIILDHNALTGPISSFQGFNNLIDIDLSYNILTGPIPSFQGATNLISIYLSSNALTGPIPSFHGATNLMFIELSSNALTGPMPSFQGATKLYSIDLSSNALTGPVPSVNFEGLSKLGTILLFENSLNGSIPSFLFSCPFLTLIDISNNQFSGSVQLGNFYMLPNLLWLDLSHNNLVVNASINDSILSSFPQLINLGLTSCKLQTFPPLMNQSKLTSLDLSDNQIFGVVPNWISNFSMASLNLSCNHLVGFEQGFVFSDVNYLDLHSNQLRGEIPIPPERADYVDYSRNNFSSSITAEIGNRIAKAFLFSLSDNMLSGSIPPSICNGSNLQILDLSNNRFTGTLPQCLIGTSTMALGVLNLQNNQLTGKIMGTFPKNCTLWTLELNGNHLEGEVPKSLANCANAEIINLGTNELNGNFPCFLANLSNLRVLVLRSNKLHGNIHCRGVHHNVWPMLQIIDLALNNFSGILPPKFFSQRNAMMDGANAQPNLTYLGFQEFDGTYYEFSVIVMNKGANMNLVRILSIFTAIDFSSNNFQGKIPDTIKDLNYLHVLNLSHNDLSDSIPSSLGNLTQLESLDLSWNKLSGSIPVTLASLTFLEFLNLSYNQLVGMIPRGTQLQSFSETSFEGNKGLCGAPLVVSCNEPEPTPPTLDNAQSDSEEDEKNLVYITATVGYTFGFGVIVVPLLFSKRWRQSYYKLIGMEN